MDVPDPGQATVARPAEYFRLVCSHAAARGGGLWGDDASLNLERGNTAGRYVERQAVRDSWWGEITCRKLWGTMISETAGWSHRAQRRVSGSPPAQRID